MRGDQRMQMSADRATTGGRQVELPRFYYHEHFAEMLDFVLRHYVHVMDEEARLFVDSFLELPHAQQCLYIRLANRKGRLFEIARLRYPELGELRPLVDALHSSGWVGSPEDEHYPEILACLTRGETYSIAKCCLPGLRSSVRKPELIEALLEQVQPEEFLTMVDSERFVVQARTETLSFLTFLYFGSVREGMQKFTLRDLGLVRTHRFRDSYEPRFADREEAWHSYYYASRVARFRHAVPSARESLAAESGRWPEPCCAAAEALRDDLAFEIARWLEAAGRGREAIEVWRLGSSDTCREGQVRALLASGERDAARAALDAWMADCGSEEGWLAATDLLERKFGDKRTTPLTDVLRSAETIHVDESLCGSPERAAISYFEQQGMAAHRAENRLWRTLFGLLFWDIIYDRESTTLHSPFEALPAALVNGSFYDENRDAIELRLDDLDDTAATKRRLLRIVTAQYGVANGIFRWRRSMTEALFALLDAADPVSVAGMLRRMCGRYREMRTGFPDLLVIDGSGCRFVEIKADGDQLRRNQLARLEQLRAEGFRADVLRVRWIIDPEQTYVVVDVETTGGMGDRHRVTEVGAVKVRGGKIVDRFQSLVNPGRRIPPRISRLTGITDDMVAGAPLFSDISDEFEDFMDGAIFVAHNVNFDYGFISREYARLGRPFRHPKLCTCSSMRKLFPGHASYSLKSLCEIFGVRLVRHHRALSDAEAAAELLLLVNDKRAEALAEPVRQAGRMRRS